MVFSVDEQLRIARDRRPVFVGVVGSELLRVALRVGEWDVPEIIVRHAEVGDDVATGAFRVPGQLINAREPARNELWSSAPRREFPEISVRTIVAGLLVRQILVQRVKKPFAVGRARDRHSRRLPGLRKQFDRRWSTGL